MAEKKIWVTWLPGDAGSQKPDQILGTLHNYGFRVGGAPWVDDLKRMEWYELGTLLLEVDKVDLWFIAGTRNDLISTSNRYALSLVAAIVREGRGAGFSIFCLVLDDAIDPAAMPLLTRDFSFLSAASPDWPAKITAAFLKKTKIEPHSFRFNAVGHPIIGHWFEVGPREGEWQGVMFGVSAEGKITHHMVGPKGQLPEKSILEYPIIGIKAEVGGVEYTASSVQNRISSNDSYYVKIEGFPSRILFGGHPGTDQAEVTVIELS
jgi:hypothetical protein